ncbi:TonB-dependent receptor [Paraflavisolibacter sp. H34]|uniref:SusC/RagA family TonB-linked outer membrane protein n=1 Tax=Huijunlia imazamoxiresistens TaxID=3127457 RepID=UPI0030182740
MKRFLALFLMAFCLAATSWGQGRQITGSVVDDSSSTGLSDVSVTIKGATAGTRTDDRGAFTLTIPGTAGRVDLVISSVGYLAQTVGAEVGKKLSVRLRKEASSLNEVVVVGYGTVRKKDLTGSVVSVKGEELKKVPTTNVLDAAQGKIAGADITRSSGQAGAGVSIRVRGNRSIGGNNAPLFIVDGIQYSNIEDINPNDIESMEVLKDASSTAIYGSRGANGVILITTKKGASGRASVTFNSYGGVSQVTLYPKAMNLDEFVAFRREAYRAAGSPTDDATVFANPAERNAVQKRIWTDYQDALIHNGAQQDYQLGLSAGTDKLKAYVSGDYFNEQGILKNDWLKRYTGRLNVDYTISRQLKVGMQSQLTYYDQSIRRDPLNQANKVSPLGSIYDSTGAFNFLLLDAQTPHPLADEQPNVYKNSLVTTRTLTNAYIEVQPLPGLTARSTLGISLSSARNGIYASPQSIDRSLSGKSQATYNTSNLKNINWENVLTYQKTFADHSLTLTGVASRLSNYSEESSASGVNQLLSSQQFYNLSGNTEEIKISSNYAKSDLVSFAGRLNYGYKGRYLLNLTARQDGSSKLAEGNKWTFFPSAAVAWRLSDEHFMKDVPLLSDLKLRASYGIAGNDPSGPYVTQSNLARIAFGYDEAPAPAYTFSRQVGNAALSWELTATKNFGLDLGLFQGRATATVDVYDSRTKDLLLTRGLPPTTGVTTVFQNIGKTRNRGVEVTLGTTNISSARLTWSSNVTFTRNREEIVELASGSTSDIGNLWFVGQPIQVYYDYEKVGIWQTADAQKAAGMLPAQKPGDIQVKDQNNDGKIDSQNDRVILGNPRPKWSGGLDNNVRFGGFDFNVFVFARIGQTINADRYARFDQQGLGNSTSGLDYWTPENPTNAYPRPNKNGGLLYLGTLGYRKASYARIRNLSLGYTVPSTLLGNSFVKGIRAYATAKNLFTFTDLEYDPERGGSENFPMTKLFIVGINVNL